MPMPKPTAGQSLEDFIKSFMSNPAMIAEYPDEKQRLAVANSQYKTKAEDDKQEESTRTKIAAAFGAPGKDGKEWEITLMSEGRANTLTGTFVLPKEVMKASLDIFEGVGVYAHQYGINRNGIPDFNHRPNGMEDPNQLFINKIGWVDKIRLDTNGARSRIMGTFHCINSSVRDMLLNIWETDKSKMPEFSIDAETVGDRIGNAIHIKAFKKAHSLDMVTKGAFEGAGFERLVAVNKFNIGGKEMDELIKQILANIKAGKMQLEGSEGKSDDELTSMIKASLGLENSQEENIDEKIKAAITPEMIASIMKLSGMDEMKAALADLIKKEKVQPEKKEAVKAAEKADKEAEEAKMKAAAEAEKSNTDKIADLENTIKVQASANMVERILASEKTLGDESKNRIRAMYDGKVVKEDEIKNALKSEKEYLDRIIASYGHKEADGRTMIVIGDSPKDKLEKALELFINPNMDNPNYNKENATDYRVSASERFVDLRDAVLAFSGQARFRNDDPTVTMKAAASTGSFTTVFQDVMNKQIRKQYDIAMVNDRLGKLVEEVSVETLDQQHIYDIGSFGLLSDVAEAGTYQELSNPDDVEATYTLKKIGDIFRITEEMFYTSGSKVTQLIRQFPRKMASSAKATRNKYIADRITGCNGSTVNALNIYDGTPLYTSAHNNLGSSALDYTAFYSGYTAMGNQTVLNSGLPAEIEARFLLVPHELKPTALNIVEAPQYPVDTNGAVIKNPYSGLGVEVISLPNYYLCSDTNNWYLIGNKSSYPTLQIGYFQNQKAPQIYLQNTDTVGNVFTNDQWTYKAKWRFGGAITDYRTFYAGIVAGN